jgi:hypothetical protein
MVKQVASQVAEGRPGQGSPTPLSAIRKRAQKVSNLWIFDSPKNACRLTVSGDVPFMHLILLEGVTTVRGYDLVDDPFNVSSSNSEGYVRLRYYDGREEWLTIGRQSRPRARQSQQLTQQDGAVAEKAAAAGIVLHRRSELELAGKEVLFDNWLTLCAIITRARPYPSYQEQEKFLDQLKRHGALRVSDVLATPNVDRAIMLAVIAKSLQTGIVETDLGRHLFGTHSTLSRVRA